MAMKEEQGMRRAMLGWWAFLCSCLTTGSEEGLLEEGLDVSLVAGVSTWVEALISLCSCLGDGLMVFCLFLLGCLMDFSLLLPWGRAGVVCAASCNSTSSLPDGRRL